MRKLSPLILIAVTTIALATSVGLFLLATATSTDGSATTVIAVDDTHAVACPQGPLKP